MRIGLVLLVALLLLMGIPLLVNAWARRREDVDNYHERDFRDPPTMGGTWPSGGSGGGMA